MKPPSTPQLEDDAEIARREFERCIIELQSQTLVNARVIKGVKLVDGVATAVPHGFGRPVLVFISAVRGGVAAGRVDDLRDGTVDLAKYINLKATGYGATVYVDLLVVPS